MTRKIIYIFVAILVTVPVSICLEGTTLRCYGDEEFEDEEIDCPLFKSEVRKKYGLADQKSGVDDIEDNRTLVGELEQLLVKRRNEKELAPQKESAETAMNRRMVIANLEYEIDKIEDFIPEVKAKKDKERELELAKRASNSGEKSDHDLQKSHTNTLPLDSAE